MQRFPVLLWGAVVVVVVLLLLLVQDVAPMMQLRFPYSHTNFSLALYKAAFNEEQNVVVAPFTLQNSIAMLYSIATGTTRDRLREVFALPANFTEFISNQKELHYSLADGSEGFRMKNRIIVNGFREVDARMRDIMSEDLNTLLMYLDFGQRESVIRRANHFLNVRTNGLIRDTLFLGDVPKHLQLIQLSAGSCRPPFASGFDPRDTFGRDFRTGWIEKLYQTNTMYKEGEFRFARIPELEIEVLELPFQSRSDSIMWIMLPDRDAGLERIVKALEPEHFDAIHAHFSMKRASIVVPVFSIKTEFNATDFLRDTVGLEAMFRLRELRFFDDHDSSLNSVMHRAAISVHERTAEAGGVATVHSFSKRSAASYQFYVGRSFLFAILKRSSKQILFIGHLYKPHDLTEV
ncbi:serine protease inhibitor, non-inhibitory [Anopheles darlingi]|uniref:Serine protease inhibitor, non-inhibitory n=1 Tax=Anopheles darlingi TaxID=43151 RepID=W5JS65_ANODA|nr:serine protease inhibitor, non-inhibitory [Anopheles darlingi]